MYLTFEQYDMSPTPEQLQAIYASGFPGVLSDPFERALAHSQLPDFYDAVPDAANQGRGQLSLPFRAALTLDPEFGRYEAQTTGDCLPRHSLVRMADGSLRRIEDVQQGEYVQTPQGNARRVLRTIRKERSHSGTVSRIRVSRGERDLVVTPDHLVLVQVNDGQRWIAAADLRPGDEVVCPPRDMPVRQGDDASAVAVLEGARTATVQQVVSELFDDEVFCLTVATDEAFVADGFAVHNCVSHSTRNAGMLDYCLDALFGETSYEGRLATEPIYGYRGHGGQGASCDRLARYVSQNGPGGFLPRKSYSEGGQTVDLSRYNSRIGHNWGRGGTPDWLNKLAAQNKALQVMQCRSLDQARDALAAGFGLSRCGWWGYSNRRNEDGVSDVSGRWAHAMAIIACDDTPWAHEKYRGALWLVQNSWGLWNGGPKRHEQPDGSYWITSQRFEAEVKAGGVYVIGSVRGYDRELVYERTERVAELSAA